MQYHSIIKKWLDELLIKCIQDTVDMIEQLLNAKFIVK